jgi:tRNA(Ile2) C34 agmatinyltransferase TiaS
MKEPPSPKVNRMTERGSQQLKKRMCLKCGVDFPSLGPGNRRCVKCAKNAGKKDYGTRRE